MRSSVMAVVVGMCALATGASAAMQNVLLAEVLGSWQGDDEVQFVELAISGDGGTSTSGGTLTFTTGSDRHSLQITRDMTNGGAGSRILFATDRASDVLGISPDFVLPSGSLPSLTGRICYQVTDSSGDTDVVDCLAYGNYEGSNGDFGRTLRISPDNRSLVRIDTSGTNRSDWRGAVQPTPQNNAGTAVTLATLCGDEHIDAGEQCDGDNLDGQGCKSMGYKKGTLACSQCHFDVSDCVACGNGVRDSGEQCDGDDFGDKTCIALGFTGGDLGCTSACKVDTAGCDATLFVPGGGPSGPECLAEWMITNGSQRPGDDGKVPPRQACTDGDPNCDMDDVGGTCTFAVSVCFDVDDARFTKDGKSCRHAPIASWSVVRATGDGVEAVVDSMRTAVSDIAASSVDGNTVTFAEPLDVESVCSDVVLAVVGTGNTAAVKTRTMGGGGKPRDVDALRLVCVE